MPDRRYFVVPTQHLKRILASMTDEWNTWCCEDDGEDMMITYFTRDDKDFFQTVVFVFPMVILEDGPSETVLISQDTARQVRKGVYLEDDGLKNDTHYDWEKFWTPLREALAKKAKTN